MPKTTTRRLAYDFPTFYSLTNGRFLDKKIDFGSLCTVKQMKIEKVRKIIPN